MPQDSALYINTRFDLPEADLRFFVWRGVNARTFSTASETGEEPPRCVGRAGKRLPASFF